MQTWLKKVNVLVSVVLVLGLLFSPAPDLAVAEGGQTLYVANWTAPTSVGFSGRPAVVHDNGTYHMWYSVSDTELRYTSSTDPASFTAGTAVSFTTGSPVERGSVSVIKEGDTFYMINYGASNTVFHIYTSSDGLNWDDAGLVFDLGSLGYKIDAPSLLKDDAGYKLYFQVRADSTSTSVYNLYMATSSATSLADIALTGDTPDFDVANAGVTILPLGASGAWDDFRHMHPWVIKGDTNYYMWFVGYSVANSTQKIGFASSTDGINWIKSPGNPIISVGYEPTVSKVGADWHMWYGTSAINHIQATGPLEFATIQSAIDSANAGDTILIGPGTYVENIRINKSISLDGAGPTTIIVPAISLPNPCEGSSLCGGPTAASNVILVESSDVLIKDLTIDGDNPSLTSGIVRNSADLDARNGIIKNIDATYDNLEVFNTMVKNIYLRGIYSTGGSFNFHDNTVINVMGDSYSIAMFAWGGPGTMESNTVSFASDAISANHSKGIQFLNNSVTNSLSGIHTDNSNDGGGVPDLIQGNSVDCTDVADSYGIWTFVPYASPVVNGNTITNCSIGLSAWAGPFTAVSAVSTFTSNQVTGDGSAGSVGAYITTDTIGWGYTDVSVLFEGNTITGFETGLQFTADEQSWNPEPFVAKKIDADFFENQIYDNIVQVLVGTAGTYNIDLSPNWWGSAVEPTLPASVTYVPWCGDAACTWFMPPTVDDQSVTTPWQTPVDITLTSSDVGGNTLVWTIIDGPANGTVSVTGNVVTYTPDAGFSGSDSFTFKAGLGGVDSNVGTVTIIVDEPYLYYFPIISNN